MTPDPEIATKNDQKFEEQLVNLRAFLARWYRPLESGDGCTEEEVYDTEKRLGFRLPESLRELYFLIGRAESLWQQNRMVRLADLVLEDGYLVFWEENQCVTLEAIAEKDLALANPPVLQLMDFQVTNQSNADSVEATAILLLAWELLTTGDFSGTGEADSIAQIRKESVDSPFPILSENDVYYLNNSIVYLIDDTQLWIAAQNENDFLETIRQYPGVNWSHSVSDSRMRA